MKKSIRRVTDADIAAMATEGASADPERSGSPDKDGAVAAENAPPKVKRFTVEGQLWMERDPYGLTTEGLYGKKDQTALQPEDLQRHAQFLGAPMGPTELEVIHGVDETAPKDGVTCPTCNKSVTSFVRTALIDRETGDLLRDKNTGVVTYRGQFVAAGGDALNLTVHGAHPGECLFRLRLKRDRNGDVVYQKYNDAKGNERSKPVMLPCQAFDQANARAEGVKASILAKRDKRAANENAFKQRLGFKVGDAVRHSGGGNRTDDGINRGSFAPKTPRGQSRKQRNWTEDATE